LTTKTNQDSIDALKNHNLKVTKSRLEVLKVLQESEKPLTHSEIMERLDHSQNWDRVTIYRTLGEFSEKNLIKSLMSQDRVTYFELSGTHPGHAHVTCLDCGVMECLDEGDYQFSLKDGREFSVQSVEILVKGICKDCR
jgi:Fur family transcriptional regulator, ferric uptake regulator